MTSPFENLRTQLAEVGSHGNEHRATCPAHDDQSLSLSLAESADGAALVYCAAGCDVADVLASIEWTLADLFPDSTDDKSLVTACYPYADAAGNVRYQVQRLEPGLRGARVSFTVTPASGEGPMARVPLVPYRLPEVVAAVEAGRRVFVVEGEKDVDALVRAGQVATCNPLGAGQWATVKGVAAKVLAGAEVTIVADKDKAGRAHATRVAASLDGVAASVTVVEAKEGKDAADHLALGHGPDDFVPLAISSNDGLPDDGALKPPRGPYHETPTGLIWMRPTSKGSVALRMTNFTARIVSDVTTDDGAEVRRHFAIEAQLGDKTSHFIVPVERFASLDWAIRELGAAAIVYPGFHRDHVRVAIQQLSVGLVERRVFAHTGWRCIAGGDWVYLHAHGAIDRDGTVPGVDVSLPSSLAKFALPDPPDSEDLRDSIEASLALLDVAPDRVTVPLLGAVYRAPLGSVDCSVFLAGRTGVGKSELAARAQQHWGPALDRLSLPGNWSSTANSLEDLAFVAKDALVVVDDFAPEGTGVDRSKLFGTAARLLRAQGNHSGRGRLRQDGAARPERPPRGMVMSTGEDTPRGHSILARTPVAEVEPGDVDLDKLTVAQRDGEAGRYAAAMAGYVRWLAARRDAEPARMRARVAELRATFQGPHSRTPAEMAELAVGWETWLEYAIDSGAVTAAERDTLWKRVLAALASVAAAQADHLSNADPVRRFVDLLRSALSSGRAHVATTAGDAPAPAGPWGWRRDDLSVDYQAGGPRVGWVDGPNLYLDPPAALAAAQSVPGHESADPLGVSETTLGKRLREGGLLVTTDRDTARGSLKVRRTVEGARRQVWHLRADALVSLSREASDQRDHGSQESADDNEDGRVRSPDGRASGRFADP